MPPRKEIVYPVFLECGQFTQDVFWESVFEDLAYARPPAGTYISKDFLTCSYKGKEFSYKIERKDPKVLYEDIYGLLTKKLELLSNKEKSQKRIMFNELERNIKSSRTDWSSIRRKNVKDIMYERYVIDMKKKWNLSVEQCKYLLSVVILAVMFKSITTKDIIYADDKIQDIKGIEFQNGKIMLKKSLCANIPDFAPDEEISGISIMSDNWVKYIKNLEDRNYIDTEPPNDSCQEGDDGGDDGGDNCDDVETQTVCSEK